MLNVIGNNDTISFKSLSYDLKKKEKEMNTYSAAQGHKNPEKKIFSSKNCLHNRVTMITNNNEFQ